MHVHYNKPCQWPLRGSTFQLMQGDDSLITLSRFSRNSDAAQDGNDWFWLLTPEGVWNRPMSLFFFPLHLTFSVFALRKTSRIMIVPGPEFNRRRFERNLCSCLLLTVFAVNSCISSHGWVDHTRSWVTVQQFHSWWAQKPVCFLGHRFYKLFRRAAIQTLNTGSFKRL